MNLTMLKAAARVRARVVGRPGLSICIQGTVLSRSDEFLLSLSWGYRIATMTHERSNHGRLYTSNEYVYFRTDVASIPVMNACISVCLLSL